MKAHFPLPVCGQKRQGTHWLGFIVFHGSLWYLLNHRTMRKPVSFHFLYWPRLSLFRSPAWDSYTCNGPKANTTCMPVWDGVLDPAWAACCVMANFHLSRQLIFSQLEAWEFCRSLLSAGGEADATSLLLGWCCFKDCKRGTFPARLDLTPHTAADGRQLCQEGNSNRSWSGTQGFHQKCQSYSRKCWEISASESVSAWGRNYLML